MNASHDISSIVRSWIREDEHESADTVLEIVLSRLDSTPQRRPFWRAWRFPKMNSPVRYAIAAAAVLVVALVGYQFLPSTTQNPGTGGTPRPSSVGPSPTASATASIPRLPDHGPIQAGTYRMGTDLPFRITIPSGWESIGGWSVRKHNDEPTEVALDFFGTDLRVFADACASAGTDAAIGPTVDDLIAALAAQENSDVAEPVDITVAGLPGTLLEISAPAGLDLQQCSINDLQIWFDEEGGGYLAGVGPADNPAFAQVADARGGRLTFVPHHQPDATAADIAERDAMVASIAVE